MRLPGALALVVSLLSGLACSAEGSAPLPAPPATAAASAAAAAPTWSREAFSPASAGTHAADPRAVVPSDPGALADLVAAAPRSASRPTADDGGTAIGRDTGLPIEAGAPVASVAPAPEAQVRSRVAAGEPALSSGMPQAAIERAARAQLYWNLVQRCRDPEGNILPPGAIQLHFRIDGDGSIVRGAIVATPHSPRFTEAAACMQRELSTTTFQAPAGARGRESKVDVAVPSVD